MPRAITATATITARHARVLDHPLISERYFFPRPTSVATPEIIAVAGAELHCFRSAPHPGAMTLLHFHGNGEVVADWLSFAESLNARGVNVVLAEYRGYGGSSGVPQLARMLDDALTIADAAAAAPGRLVVYGRSVGSIYALHVAAQRPVAGLIIESGIADVLPRLALRMQPEELGVDAETLSEAASHLLDHRAKVQAFGGPVLVMHAQGDDMVSPDNARELAAWAGERATLKLFGRGDHNSIHFYNGDAITDEVATFVSKSAPASAG